MVHDDLDTLQRLDEVNIKRMTLIQCLMVGINYSFVPCHKPIDFQRRKLRSLDVQVSDFLFCRQARCTRHWEALSPQLPA